MVKAFFLPFCVILVRHGFKTKGAMEQILQANMNPGELNHFMEDVFFLYQYYLFFDILISEIEPCLSLGEVKAPTICSVVK